MKMKCHIKEAEVKEFVLGAAISGGILFFFVSQTWIVVVVFWLIIAVIGAFAGSED